MIKIEDATVEIHGTREEIAEDITYLIVSLSDIIRRSAEHEITVQVEENSKRYDGRRKSHPSGP